MISKPTPQFDTFLTFILFFSKAVLYLTGTILLITGLFFLIDYPVHNNALVLILSISVALLLLIWEFKNLHQIPIGKLSVYILASVSIMVLLIILIGQVYDKSWDGQAYHQIGILELSKGWNPFYEQLPYESMHSKHFDRAIILNLWVNHYAKALETFSAIIMTATSNIESGKALNILLLLSAFCSVFYLLMKLNFLNATWSFILAFAASFNPITINQLFSYYLDGAVGCLVLILITQLGLLLCTDFKSRQSHYISIFFTSVILINLKFTGVVYYAGICFVFFCLILYLKTPQLVSRFLVVIIISSLASVLIAGFNPYVTNTFQYSHPFHPLAGKDKVDAIIHMTPKALNEYNSVTRFLISNFSRCTNFGETSNRSIEYKIPFTFSLQELKIFQGEAIRLGGFGPLWSGIFCLTLVMLVITMIQLKGNARIYFLALVLCIIGSVVINPAAWWARFIPQLWLLPVIVIAFFLYAQKKYAFIIVGKTALCLLLLNTALIALVYFFAVYNSTTSANRMFDEMKKSTAPVFVYFDIFTPNEKKLEANHIPFIKVKTISELPCENPMNILRMDYCKTASGKPTH